MCSSEKPDPDASAVAVDLLRIIEEYAKAISNAPLNNSYGDLLDDAIMTAPLRRLPYIEEPPKEEMIALGSALRAIIRSVSIVKDAVAQNAKEDDTLKASALSQTAKAEGKAAWKRACVAYICLFITILAICFHSGAVAFGAFVGFLASYSPDLFDKISGVWRDKEQS